MIDDPDSSWSERHGVWCVVWGALIVAHFFVGWRYGLLPSLFCGGFLVAGLAMGWIAAIVHGAR